MSTRTARAAIEKALAGLDRMEGGVAKYTRAVDRLGGTTPEMRDYNATRDTDGKRALVDMQLGADDARTYGTVAIALLLEQLLAVASERPMFTPDGGIGGAVKRAAGRPAPRPAGGVR